VIFSTPIHHYVYTKENTIVVISPFFFTFFPPPSFIFLKKPKNKKCGPRLLLTIFPSTQVTRSSSSFLMLL